MGEARRRKLNAKFKFGAMQDASGEERELEGKEAVEFFMNHPFMNHPSGCTREEAEEIVRTIEEIGGKFTLDPSGKIIYMAKRERAERATEVKTERTQIIEITEEEFHERCHKLSKLLIDAIKTEKLGCVILAALQEMVIRTIACYPDREDREANIRKMTDKLDRLVEEVATSSSWTN